MPTLSKFKGEGDGMSLKYSEGRVSMMKGKADGKECVRVKLDHAMTGNSFDLGFTMNGLAAFVILAEEMLKQRKVPASE